MHTTEGILETISFQGIRSFSSRKGNQITWNWCMHGCLWCDKDACRIISRIARSDARKIMLSCRQNNMTEKCVDCFPWRNLRHDKQQFFIYNMKYYEQKFLGLLPSLPDSQHMIYSPFHHKLLEPHAIFFSEEIDVLASDHTWVWY